MGTWEVLLLIGMGVSVGLLLLVNLPGNFFLVLNATWYGAVTGFHRYGWNFVLTLLAVAAMVELVEYLVLAFGKKGYSASKILVFGALLGAIIGAVVGFFFSPVVDSIIGGFLGAIIGTVLFELIYKKNSLKETKNALLGVLVGRMGGLTLKTIGTVMMSIMIAYKVF